LLRPHYYPQIHASTMLGSQLAIASLNRVNATTFTMLNPFTHSPRNHHWIGDQSLDSVARCWRIGMAEVRENGMEVQDEPAARHARLSPTTIRFLRSRRRPAHAQVGQVRFPGCCRSRCQYTGTNRTRGGLESRLSIDKQNVTFDTVIQPHWQATRQPEPGT